MKYEQLTNENFLFYCAKYYKNPGCHSTKEFLDDVKRIRYIKKLFTRYDKTKELEERLILNHFIILSNVFEDHLPRIVYLKMKKELKYAAPFLHFLNIMPVAIQLADKDPVFLTDMITMDQGIINALRRI